MKGKTLSVIGILANIVGALLIAFRNEITSNGVVTAGGILFVAVGVCNLIIFSQRSRETRSLPRMFNMIANIAAIVLGICMLVFKPTFVPLVSFMFGLLVAACALWQFFLLAIGARPYTLPAWHYAFPVLLAAGAAYIFTQEKSGDYTITLATGIAMALLGVACVVEGSTLGAKRRATAKEAKAAAEAASAREEATTSAEKPLAQSQEAENSQEAAATSEPESTQETPQV